MKEQDIQKKIKDWLEKQGAYVVKVISASKAGVPDLLVCYKGRFIGIEVKTPKTKTNVSDLQNHNIELIHKANGYAIVAWDLEGVQKFISNLEDYFKDRGFDINETI